MTKGFEDRVEKTQEWLESIVDKNDSDIVSLNKKSPYFADVEAVFNVYSGRYDLGSRDSSGIILFPGRARSWLQTLYRDQCYDSLIEFELPVGSMMRDTHDDVRILKIWGFVIAVLILLLGPGVIPRFYLFLTRSPTPITAASYLEPNIAGTPRNPEMLYRKQNEGLYGQCAICHGFPKSYPAGTETQDAPLVLPRCTRQDLPSDVPAFE